jgi:hypothetical protein
MALKPQLAQLDKCKIAEVLHLGVGPLIQYRLLLRIYGVCKTHAYNIV